MRTWARRLAQTLAAGGLRLATWLADGLPWHLGLGSAFRGGAHPDAAGAGEHPVDADAATLLQGLRQELMSPPVAGSGRAGG